MIEKRDLEPWFWGWERNRMELKKVIEGVGNWLRIEDEKDDVRKLWLPFVDLVFIWIIQSERKRGEKKVTVPWDVEVDDDETDPETLDIMNIIFSFCYLTKLNYHKLFLPPISFLIFYFKYFFSNYIIYNIDVLLWLTHIIVEPCDYRLDIKLRK